MLVRCKDFPVLRFLFTITILMISNLAIGQTGQLQIPSYLTLPEDSILSSELIKSLNGFLSFKEEQNKMNPFILREDLTETSLLLDEFKGIERSTKHNDDNFYKSYLTNVVHLEASSFIVQISYLGVSGGTPIHVASFELLAKQKNNRFYFSSPLKKNTSIWKTKQINNFSFHYKSTLNKRKIKEYVRRVIFYDKKLGAPIIKTEWYGCDNMPEVLEQIGVKYKLIHNGRDSGSFSSREDNSLLIMSGSNNGGFNSFDPHDLWHERLRNVVPKNITNKPIDEGCAYLFGGSWGMSWGEILEKFKKKVASEHSTDWLDLYGRFKDFSENEKEPLLVEYVINALIVKKIEEEKGFKSVLEFLKCGQYQNDNANYFNSLEKIAGINKSNFNEKIWDILRR